MLRKLILILLTVCLFGIWGCGKKKSTEPTSEEDVVVKTIEQHKAQADKEITEQNLDAELDKLEKEIGDDIAAGQ